MGKTLTNDLMVYSASDDRSVGRWDSATGESQGHLTGHAGPVAGVIYAGTEEWTVLATSRSRCGPRDGRTVSEGNRARLIRTRDSRGSRGNGGRGRQRGKGTQEEVTALRKYHSSTGDAGATGEPEDSVSRTDLAPECPTPGSQAIVRVNSFPEVHIQRVSQDPLTVSGCRVYPQPVSIQVQLTIRCRVSPLSSPRVPSCTHTAC